MGGVATPAKRAILIAGPTASGKSAVAAAVAEALGGTVVNADSMQVYRDLRILTARPTAAEEGRVPHRLFGHVDAAHAYSVGQWLREMAAVLAEAERDGRVPVLVGGTGLYIKALTQGLSPMPDVPAPLRERLRAEGLATPPMELHRRLAACDPVMAARLRPTDPQRVLRALEVFEATGVSLATFQERREPALLPEADVLGLFMAPSRERLYAAIDSRFDAMMTNGALAEIEALALRKLDPDLPAMRALGVPDLIGALDSPGTLPAAVTAAKTATRHYAKRQLTFARHQLSGLPWIDPGAARETLLEGWRRETA